LSGEEDDKSLVVDHWTTQKCGDGNM